MSTSCKKNYLQKGNIRNQRENMDGLSQMLNHRLGIPTESDCASDIFAQSLRLYVLWWLCHFCQTCFVIMSDVTWVYVASYLCLSLNHFQWQKIDEKAVTDVFFKVLDNSIKWCKYFGIQLVWNKQSLALCTLFLDKHMNPFLIFIVSYSLEAINRDR